MPPPFPPDLGSLDYRGDHVLVQKHDIVQRNGREGAQEVLVLDGLIHVHHFPVSGGGGAGGPPHTQKTVERDRRVREKHGLSPIYAPCMHKRHTYDIHDLCVRACAGGLRIN